MGHLNERDLRKLFPNATGDLMFCATCKLGKMKSLPFNLREKKRCLLERVYVDKVGPSDVDGIMGERYFYGFTDDYSVLNWKSHQFLFDEEERNRWDVALVYWWDQTQVFLKYSEEMTESSVKYVLLDNLSSYNLQRCIENC